MSIGKLAPLEMSTQVKRPLESEGIESPNKKTRYKGTQVQKENLATSLNARKKELSVNLDNSRYPRLCQWRRWNVAGGRPDLRAILNRGHYQIAVDHASDNSTKLR